MEALAQKASLSDPGAGAAFGGNVTSGQGKPLPPFLQIDGEWIIENHVFLYHSDNSSSGALTRIAETTGAPAIGFDVAQLAAEFEVDVPTIIAANRNHTLAFRGTQKIAPTHGGDSAIAYWFGLGNVRKFLTIERYHNEGTA